MVLRSFALLSVASYLTSQIVKALFWSIYLAMAIAAWAQESNRPDFFEAWVWITSVVVVVTVTSVIHSFPGLCLMSVADDHEQVKLLCVPGIRNRGMCEGVSERYSVRGGPGDQI